MGWQWGLQPAASQAEIGKEQPVNSRKTLGVMGEAMGRMVSVSVQTLSYTLSPGAGIRSLSPFSIKTHPPRSLLTLLSGCFFRRLAPKHTMQTSLKINQTRVFTTQKVQARCGIGAPSPLPAPRSAGGEYSGWRWIALRDMRGHPGDRAG